MQITYRGDLGVVLKGDSATVALALNPKDVGDEDVVVTRAFDDKVKAKKEQAVIDWPGEYEARGVAVMVIPVGAEKKGRVVKLLIDDIAIAHLTDVSAEITEAEGEKIGNIDILFVPTGKAHALTIKAAQSIIETIEPRVVIPIGFSGGEQLEFAKALGFSEVPEIDVFKCKKSDLPADRMELQLLKAR